MTADSAQRDLFAAPDRLHRVHAAPARGKGGCRVDIGSITWRPEGPGALEERRACAYRMALAWNLCEGWPTAALERGVLREVDELAEQLAAAVLSGGPAEDVATIARRLRGAFAERDRHFDMTGGRPADCDRCYPPAAEDDRT